MMLMTEIIAELLVKLTTRGRQLGKWLVTTARYGCKGRRISAETLALITDIHIILGEWDEISTNIRNDVEEKDSVDDTGNSKVEVVQELEFFY